MRKEVLFAIISGVIFGLVIAFGIWRANSFLNSSPENQEEQIQASPAATDNSEPQVQGIAIVKPEDNEVILENPVDVSGIATGMALVLISGEDQDYLFIPQEDGTFEEEVEMVPALNYIELYAFDTNGQVHKASLNLVYSGEFANDISSLLGSVENEEQNVSTGSVEQVVQEKLQLASNKPKAYMGTVTDITDSTIQLKNDSGEILQISLDQESTSFVQLSDSSSTDVEYEDVAIGDNIIAMGFIDENEVLDAIRILIITSEVEVARKIVVGNVDGIEGRELEVSSGEESVFLNFPRRWNGPEMDEINPGDKVVVVYLIEEGENTLRTIAILNSSSSTPEE